MRTLQSYLLIDTRDNRRSSSPLWRSRRELSNEYLRAKFGFDTAENKPCQPCRIRTNSPYPGHASGADAAQAKGNTASGAATDKESDATDEPKKAAEQGKAPADAKKDAAKEDAGSDSAEWKDGEKLKKVEVEKKAATEDKEIANPHPPPFLPSLPSFLRHL